MAFSVCSGLLSLWTMRIFLATWKNSMELQAVRDVIYHFKQSSFRFMGKGENDDLSRIIHLVLRVIIERKG